MTKKFICPICGYVHEGAPAPERCPQCKQVVTWKEVDESAGIAFACEHIIGVAKDTDDKSRAHRCSRKGTDYLGGCHGRQFYSPRNRQALRRRRGVLHHRHPLGRNAVRIDRPRRSRNRNLRSAGPGSAPRRHYRLHSARRTFRLIK